MLWTFLCSCHTRDALHIRPGQYSLKRGNCYLVTVFSTSTYSLWGRSVVALSVVTGGIIANMLHSIHGPYRYLVLVLGTGT